MTVFNIRKHIPEEPEPGSPEEAELFKYVTPESREDYRRMLLYHLRNTTSTRRGHAWRGIPNIYVREDHYHPKVRRHHFGLMGEVRKAGLRGATIAATILALDLDNPVHFRWLQGLDRVAIWPYQNYDPTIWDFSVPWSTPEGIPLGSITEEERIEWAPSVYEVEHAAMIEMELIHGGMASMMLQVDNPEVDVDKQLELAANRKLLIGYLNRNRESVPDDPYDPNLWGHDVRLRSLELLSGGRSVSLSPAFQSEVYEYTTSDIIAPVPNRTNGVAASPVDIQAKVSWEYTGIVEGYTGAEITVTAARGGQKTYMISVR